MSADSQDNAPDDAPEFHSKPDPAIAPFGESAGVPDELPSPQPIDFKDGLPPMRRYGALPEQWVRRQRLCIYLFVATCLSTFLVGSQFFPLFYLSEEGRSFLNEFGVWRFVVDGLKYSVPLMLILLCHEMGHYLQARRYGVPATLPFFIPLPIPPLGTMGAVIVQGAGVANRKAMFDIAVSGPLAGLVIALPVLYYGVTESSYVQFDFSQGGIEFGEPLLLQYMIQSVHGPQPEGMVLLNSSLLFAGWVGVLITALNLVPVGQLDGGHILYTLIGKKAHYVAYATLAVGFGYMVYIRYPAYLLLFILMIVMGPKHPPTSNDAMPLGWGRHVIGWLTLAFIIIGFTLKPIVVHESEKKQETNPKGEVEIIPLDASTGIARHLNSV